MKPLLTFLVLCSSNAIFASEFGCPSCQSCGGDCVLRVKQVEEEENCHDIECKEVCIPAVRFPWDNCRADKRGRVRVVTKLTEKMRPKSVCKYEWLVTCTRCGRAVSPPNDKSSADSETKPADDAAPMPPTAPPASAAWNRATPLQRTAKLPVDEVSNYIGRSRTR